MVTLNGMQFQERVDRGEEGANNHASPGNAERDFAHYAVCAILSAIDGRECRNHPGEAIERARDEEAAEQPDKVVPPTIPEDTHPNRADTAAAVANT